jgi:hypothetical protein
MLLGQIVAVSFASNLFFIGVLVSPGGRSHSQLNRAPRSSLQKDGSNSLLLLQAVILVHGLGAAAALPYIVKTPYFLFALLIPHLLFFAPPVFSDFSQRWALAHSTTQIIDRFSVRLYQTIILAAIAMQTLATYRVMKLDGDFNGVRGALYEHPAVSSVGWDAIYCWLSFGLWALVGTRVA